MHDGLSGIGVLHRQQIKRCVIDGNKRLDRSTREQSVSKVVTRVQYLACVRANGRTSAWVSG
jgi:hypothetical protein